MSSITIRQKPFFTTEDQPSEKINLKKIPSQIKSNYFQKDSIEKNSSSKNCQQYAKRLTQYQKNRKEPRTFSLKFNPNDNQLNLFLRISQIAQENTIKEIKDRSDKMNKILEAQIKQNLQLKYVLFIQRTFRRNKWKTIFSKLMKRQKYRRCVLEELINTEKNYVKDLALIYKEIYTPLKEQNILNDQELDGIFANIKTIYGLNENFLNDLNKKMNYFTSKSLICDIILIYVQYFKLYDDYFANYSKVQQNLQSLRINNQQFFEFINESQNNKNFDFESLLVKPIQRLPKYVLLLKELMKKTDKDHPDYKNIKLSIEEFKLVNLSNNNSIGNNILKQRQFELANIFENQTKFPILEPNRKFLSEEVGVILWKNREKTVFVYIFNNLILVSYRYKNSQKLISTLILNAQSIIKDNPDTLKFSNLYTVICENDSITFIAENQTLKNERISQFNQLIVELQQKVKSRNIIQIQNQIQLECIIKQIVKINVLATEERQEKIFFSTTYYIISIQINNTNFKIFKCYNDCLALEKIVKKKFPKITLAFIDKETKSTENLVEYRSIQIENFLSTLLNSPVIKKQPEQILEILGLPSNFYNRQITRAKTNFNTSQSPAKKMLQNTTIISTKSPKDQNLKIKVKIYSEKNPELILWANRECLVSELYNEVQQFLELKEIFDFRFILSEDSNRPINGEENVSSLFGQSSSWFFSSEEKVFFFRKYLIFNAIQEKNLLLDDPVRLSLVIRQLENDLRQSIYPESFQNYCLYFCIHLIIKNYLQIQKFPYNELSQIVPAPIIKVTKKELWAKNTPILLSCLQEQLLQQSKELGINEAILSQLIFIMNLSQHPFFGYVFFEVKPQKTIKTKFSDPSYLAISYQDIKIYDNRKKNILLKMNYNHSSIIKLYPGLIQIQESETSKYIFITQQGYYIANLMGKYIECQYQQQNQNQLN